MFQRKCLGSNRYYATMDRKRIWKIYLKENREGFANLLFMDHASMNLKDTIIQDIQKYDTIVNFLPKSLIF